MIYKEISNCRVCNNSDLKTIVALGNMYLTGEFPKNKQDKVERGPLELVKCDNSRKKQNCGLVQLRHNYQLDILYGDNYGYRSGLNKSMVNHLQGKVKKILKMVKLSSGDLIVDIASNDGTLLRAYPKLGLNLVGIDPTGNKFKQFYPEQINLIPEFFPSTTFKNKFKKKKAKIITSIAMFYDLEDPISFAQNIFENIASDGIWVFEQSYLPTMIKMLAYDTICHEHIEYYALGQIKYILDRANLKIIDVEFNAINGGSFSVVAVRKDSKYKENTTLINKIIKQEENSGINDFQLYGQFANDIDIHRNKLRGFIHKTNKSGKNIFGYGASTKGNVILQYCGITSKNIPYIAEVNENKFGCFTPGSLIPIISEEEAKKLNPDYFMVLPWHFRDNIVAREKEFLAQGKHLFFPLPKLSIE